MPVRTYEREDPGPVWTEIVFDDIEAGDKIRILDDAVPVPDTWGNTEFIATALPDDEDQTNMTYMVPE